MSNESGKQQTNTTLTETGSSPEAPANAAKSIWQPEKEWSRKDLVDKLREKFDFLDDEGLNTLAKSLTDGTVGILKVGSRHFALLPLSFAIKHYKDEDGNIVNPPDEGDEGAVEKFSRDLSTGKITIETGGNRGPNSIVPILWRSFEDNKPIIKEYLEKYLKGLREGRNESFTVGAEIEGIAVAINNGEILAIGYRPSCVEAINVQGETKIEPHNGIRGVVLAIAIKIIEERENVKQANINAEYSLMSTLPFSVKKLPRITGNPYVILTALNLLCVSEEDVTEEVRTIYEDIAERYFGEKLSLEELYNRVLLGIWPSNGFHTHVGQPMFEGEVIAEVALENARLLQTPFGELITCLTANSPAVYGRVTESKDARTAIKGVLGTNHRIPVPDTYDELLEKIDDSLKRGEVSTPGRFDGEAQHSAVRLRVDMPTVEHTGPAQHPHLGIMAAAISMHSVLSVIGVEIYNNDGQLPEEYQEYKDLLSTIEGRDSGKMMDLAEDFAKNGWEGELAKKYAVDAIKLMLQIGAKYKGLSQEALTAAAYLAGAALMDPCENIDEYFGEDGPRGNLADIIRANYIKNGYIDGIKLFEDIVKNVTKQVKEVCDSGDEGKILIPPRLVDFIKNDHRFQKYAIATIMNVMEITN